MNDKPKRPWFQIHLSTAIVLMFAAGFIVWANFEKHAYVWKDHIPGEGVFAFGWLCYGWPYPIDLDLDELSFRQTSNTYAVFYDNAIKLSWVPSSLSVVILLNCAIGILILFSVALACEYRIRRRGRKKIICTIESMSD